MRRLCPVAAVLAVALFAGIVFACLWLWPYDAAGSTETLTIVTSSGEHRFEVEIAESNEEKAKGLMFRRSMARNAGMLFPYESPQPVNMWMRNTYISLDMIFIAEGGAVHHIVRGTEPFSERTIGSQGPVVAVLEVVAGTADRIGLKRGDKVASPRLQR